MRKRKEAESGQQERSPLPQAEKRPTLAAIATAAGVSIPTVSKVLRQRGEVGRVTRERIERAMVELGYTTPETLQAQRRNMIHFIAGFFSSDYEVEILRGVDNVFYRTNMRVIFSSMHGDEGVEQRWIRETIAGATDGLILVGDTCCLAALREHNVPFVIVDYHGSFDATIPSVGVNSWAGARAATSYLLELGHRRVAHITGLPDSASLDRLAGYRAALDAASIPFDPELVREGRYVVETGYQETLALLDLPEPPTAIFAGSDLQAIGVYKALYEREMAIPRDMSVVGFDDIPVAIQAIPALTTIRHPLREMGQVAASMLLRLIAHESLDATRVELPTMLVKRESCAALSLSLR